MENDDMVPDFDYEVEMSVEEAQYIFGTILLITTVVGVVFIVNVLMGLANP